jgi:anaerobic C4-dicarboxylate transporter
MIVALATTDIITVATVVASAACSAAAIPVTIEFGVISFLILEVVPVILPLFLAPNRPRLLGFQRGIWRA